MSVKRIPITAAKRISEEYGQSHVILVTWDKTTGTTHVVTFGQTLEDCAQAAAGGNRVKEMLGFPAEDCKAKTSRQKRKEKAIRELASPVFDYKTNKDIIDYIEKSSERNPNVGTFDWVEEMFGPDIRNKMEKEKS